MHEAHPSTRGPGATTSFAAWSECVRELCQSLAALEPLGRELGAPDPASSDWHGALFGKLGPQVDREPLLVAAVCGGTNTGKSLIANALVGSEISRSVPEAAKTRHPVVSMPRGLSSRLDVASLFPGFTPKPWSSEDDALDPTDTDTLVWREDASGTQPERLVLLDTPDIDGTLRDNWQRAELVRNACDVIVAVLTQQKYNDAAVRDFFTAAATARKTIIVVFNMVEWPAQRQVIAGWLQTFVVETGAEPAAVYASPFDFKAASDGRIAFHAMAELTPDGSSADLRQRLIDCDFDRIKMRSMEGAFRVVLDPSTGAAAWLDAVEASSRGWQDARRLLTDQSRVRVEMPAAPREIVWNEIWDWLEPRRSGFDLAVSHGYRQAGRIVQWAGRRAGLLRTDAEKRDDFSTVELASLKQALGDFVDRLDDICRARPKVAAMLEDRLVQADRAAWYADLERRHAALPLVSDDYRTFVRTELDRFAAENPGMVKAVLAGLTVGSIARPVMTIALFNVGSAAVPVAAGVLHNLLDVGVTVAAPLAGEGAVAAASRGIRPLIERLFAGWSAGRSRVLAETIRDVVLGDRLERIERLAEAASRPEVARARSLLLECGRELAR
ncbi:MAG: GTPase [Planctomycetia bacterium]